METVEKLKLHSIVVDKKAVGKRIRQVRVSLPGKPSQAKFHEILYDISDKDKVSEWERGIQEPKLQDIARIAAVGDVSIEWLLTGKGKGISPTVGDSIPTLRDYCELLFVDMPRRFGVTWEIPEHYHNSDGIPGFDLENDRPCILFSLPLLCSGGYDVTRGFSTNTLDDGPAFLKNFALLECAEYMQAVQSLPADKRRMLEKDLLSKVPDDPVGPLDDDSKPM